MVRPVNRPNAPRTRRATRAAQTRQRILDAASALFADPGFAATTIEAIATRADVAVETVYSRFRSKANLLVALLEPAIVGNEDGLDLLDRPEIVEVRAATDQQQQLRLLAHFSRTILERTAHAQRILHSAAASDPAAAELQRNDSSRRYRTQAAYIDMLLTNGPLRPDVTPTKAADTYAALANPSSYRLLIDERGWTPQQYENWLADSLTRLLLSTPS